MAKNKQLDNFLGKYLFKKPEILENGTIMTPRYKTDITLFDMFLHGGFPKARIITIGAEEGVGKTTILIQALGNIARNYNKKVYYLDVEGGATYELFEAMGYADLLYDPDTNPDGLFYLIDITTIQEVSSIVKKVTQDPDTAIIVIDSDTDVVDGIALEEDDLGTSDKSGAPNARMWSKAIGPIKAVVKASQACLVIVHQARTDLSGWKPTIKASGGRAMKHATSVEIWGKRKNWIMPDFSASTASKDKAAAIGASIWFTTHKNRLGKPFQSIKIPLFFGKGVSNKWAYKEWLEDHQWVDPETGETKDFIGRKPKSSWYNIQFPWGLSTKVQGDTKVWEFVNENFEKIKDYVDSNGGFELVHGMDDDDESTAFDL